jgi:three-Cys-motif partner protein
MKDLESSFFREKRPWSRIKDRVLGTYLPPYLRKVSRLGSRIVIIDCFAGAGKFSDGKAGSPLIICQQIALHAPNNAVAYFVNKGPRHHAELARTLDPFTKAGFAHPVLGNSEGFLHDIRKHITDQTVFVYLDPFGLKGCGFDAIRALLERGTKFSTEVLINLNMPALHRLAAVRSMTRGSADSNIIRGFHSTLDSVLGSSDWRDVMWDDRIGPADKEERIVNAYKQRLARFLRYVCSCPVREADETRVKYHIVFASRHVDALLLMNDIMLDAYNQHTFDAALQDMPLFADGQLDWKESRQGEREALASVICQTVEEQPRRTRSEVWQHVVLGHFMQFRESEFRQVAAELVGRGNLQCPTPRRGNRLNDQCVLMPGSVARQPLGPAE